jgi:hypothetical protein
MWADLQAFIDALRTRWMTSVVGYDLRTQVSMLRRLANFFSSSSHKTSGANGDHDADFAGGLKRFGKFALLVLLGIGCIVAAFVWRARRGERKPGGRPIEPQVAEAVRLYQELEKALHANGRPRPPGATPLEHAQQLEVEGFSQSEEVRQVTEHYMRVRYGGGVIPGRELTRLRGAISRVRRSPRPEAPRAST